MGATTERDLNAILANRHRGAGLHQLAEQSGRFGAVKAVVEPMRQAAVQAAGHQGQLQVQIDAQRHRGRERIHVEEVDRIGDGVFDQHAPGIAVDEGGGRRVELVGEQQGGFVVAQVADRDLADRLGVILDADGLVHDARRAVAATDIAEPDALPALGGQAQQSLDHLGTAAAQGEEGNAAGLELGQVGVGGQPGVEDQFGGLLAGALLPGIGEAQDLVVLGGLGGAGAGPGEAARLGVAGQEAEDGLLAAGALGDVVTFDQGVVAVVGDGVKVEVEGAPGAEAAVEGRQGIVPAPGEGVEPAGVAAAGVLGEGGALGDDVETGEQGDAVVEHLGHDAGGASDAPQLEGEQGTQGAIGRDQGRAGQAVGEAGEIELGEVGRKQEQAAKGGAEAARGEVEGTAVGERGLQDGGLLVRGPASELGPAGLAQHVVDEADAVGQVLVAQTGGDVVDGEVVLAQGEDALAGSGGEVGVGLSGRAGRGGLVGGEEEVGIVGAEELGAEIAEAAGRVAEAAGGFGGGAALDEAGAEGLVATLAGGGGQEEAVSRSSHFIGEPMNTLKQYHNGTFESSHKSRPEVAIWPVAGVWQQN